MSLDLQSLNSDIANSSAAFFALKYGWANFNSGVWFTFAKSVENHTYFNFYFPGMYELICAGL